MSHGFANRQSFIATGGLPAAAANHVRAGNIQLIEGSQTLSRVENAELNATANTWESYGPTGSSADNIWTDLDDMPSNATAVILGVYVRAVANANPGTVQAYFAQEGITPGPDNDVRQCRISTEWETGGVNETTEGFFQVIVPLDSSRRFQFKYTQQNTDSRQIDFNYRGFITDT